MKRTLCTLLNQTVLNWCLLIVTVAGAGRGVAQPKADVYFGTVNAVDSGNRIVLMNLININIRKKAAGLQAFLVGAEADIAIEQADRKFYSGASLKDVSTQRWVWVASYDGKSTHTRVTATNFESFRGVVKDLKPDTAVVQLTKTRIGHRYWTPSPRKPPQPFIIPPTTACDFKGQPASLDHITLGTELDILTQLGKVVRVTIIK